MNKWDLSQKRKGGSHTKINIDIIHHTNRIKGETPTESSQLMQKKNTFDNIEHPFLIKTLTKLEIQGTSSA